MTIPADYAQVNFRYGGVQYPHGAEWTLGLGIASYAGTPGDLGATIVTMWYDHIRGLTCDKATLIEALVKFGPDATGPAAVTGAGFAGTVSDPPSPAAVSALFRRNTAFGGRHGRGRLYYPGLWDGAVSDGGALLSGTVAALNTAMAAFQADLIDEDLIPVLLHGDATVPYPITSFSCQTEVATQRRRQRR